MFCWNCIRLRKNRKNLTLFYFKRHYVRELQYCFTNLLLSKRKYRFTFCENVTTAWCRSSPLLLFSFTIFFRWVCLSLCFFFFCFVFVSVYIYLYWPKTVNFPFSQSFTFRSLTVGRVTWFFMVEPRLSEPVGTRRNSPDNQEYEH